MSRGLYQKQTGLPQGHSQKAQPSRKLKLIGFFLSSVVIQMECCFQSLKKEPWLQNCYQIKQQKDVDWLSPVNALNNAVIGWADSAAIIIFPSKKSYCDNVPVVFHLLIKQHHQFPWQLRQGKPRLSTYHQSSVIPELHLQVDGNPDLP